MLLMLFSFGKAEIKENWMKLNSLRKSVGCDSIANVKVVSKVECAMLFAQRSDVNLADFNVLLSTCELKFCNQINNDTFEENDDYVTIFRSYGKRVNVTRRTMLLWEQNII